ncbi:MAG: PQQ-binding-like beta-propeller repeat protein [Bacteroidaceae bacterium]|nr:PQQ-binding-like beta-propeller repeat protein [Bacteroidaceae bacterium]
MGGAGLSSLIYGADFRFAQLTDIHISSTATKQWLAQSIEQINNDSTLDFVLVTGDLTDNGDNASLEWIAAELKNINKPYYTICGNHETTWTESGLETFNRLFGERIAFEHKGYLFLGFNTGPYVRMAYGHVQPQDLNWVAQEVKQRGKDKKLILVTHYPLMEGDVDNWYEATDALRRHNPVMFIGGHYHQNLFHRYDGIPGVLGRSNLKDKDQKVGYTEYWVREDSILVYEHNINEQPRQWAGISLSQRYYDPLGHAEKYPSFSVNQRWADVKEIWKKDSGVSIYSSPAVWKNRCYVGNNEGTVVCYDLWSGKEIWKTQLGGRIVGTPATEQGVLVIGSTNHNLYGLDAKTGQTLWNIHTDEAQMGSVAVAKGMAYIAGSDHKMRAIQVKTGEIKWTFDGVTGYVVTRPLLEDGKVIFGAWDNTVYAVNQQTGKLEWTWDHLKGHLHYSAAGVWPVSDGKAVYIVDPERAMTAIDLKTGRELWRTKQSKVRESLGISKDHKRLFAKTMQDSIVCYEAHPQKVTELWACNAEFGYEHATTMLPVRDGIVYSSTKDGLVIAIEDKTGKLLWEHKVGNSFINTVVPVGKDAVLMTETSGEIALLRKIK